MRSCVFDQYDKINTSNDDVRKTFREVTFGYEMFSNCIRYNRHLQDNIDRSSWVSIFVHKKRNIWGGKLRDQIPPNPVYATNIYISTFGKGKGPYLPEKKVCMRYCPQSQDHAPEARIE